MSKMDTSELMLRRYGRLSFCFWGYTEMINRSSTFTGILFGLITGAAWGLSFLIPNMLSDFSSLEITIGRYFVYGLYSLMLFFVYKSKRKTLSLSPKVWFWSLLYALSGNIGYFFFLVLGIQYAGATVTTLIIGTLPLTISFFGNLINREFPFKIMLIPASSILIGILLMYFREKGNGVNLSSDGFLFGFFCCMVALALWTWYGISNSNFLKRETQLSADLFATIIGVQTLFLVLLFMLICWIAQVPIVEKLVIHDQFLHYLIGVTVLGIVTSWVAAWAWNQASVRLPVVLVGMIVVFETLFGLLYSYIYHARFPAVLEWGSIIFILLGVTMGIWRISVYKHASQIKERETLEVNRMKQKIHS